MIRVRAILCTMLVATLASSAWVALAQDFATPGSVETPEELSAVAELETQSYVHAREKAEAIVRENPSSFVGHFVLGAVQQEAEANFPRALFELQKALSLFEARFGAAPPPTGPWRWHARLLIAVGRVHNDMDQYEEFLRYLARYNERYRPTLLAERAWPLMKLGRYAEARAIAKAAIAGDSDWQRAVALTAMCAIEFEAGDDGASYDYCKRALDDARSRGENMTVELTNFAEASRSLFKLDEAEEITLEATRVPAAPFGNPWIDLAELYLRESRFPEALSALEEVPRYRMRRPPEVRDADRNEARRALASFFLVMGRSADALRITDRALVLPDRRAHNSRDPSQDRVIVALIDRASRLIAAEAKLEQVAGKPFYVRWLTRLEVVRLRIDAWRSSRLVEKLLADSVERLVGFFKIGTSRAAIVPPWLAGELIETVGPGVALDAIRRASATDRRPKADAYYAAFRAEALWRRGELAAAKEQARIAADRLPQAESLLRARVLAVRADCAWREGDRETASRAWASVFQSDPGVMRRLGVELPIRVEPSASELRSSFGRSPRFDVDDDAPFHVRRTGDRAAGTLCLLDATNNVLGCAEVASSSSDELKTFDERLIASFQAEIFAPRVSLSQTQANSLDGANTVTRDPLRTLLGDVGAEP